MEYTKPFTNDLEFNRRPVCPHCGYEMRYPEELDLGDGQYTTVECQRCDGAYEVRANVTTTYSTGEV